MLKEIEILEAARNKIKLLYPDIPVYLEDNKEDFYPPSFFLKLIRSTVKAGKYTTYNVCTLYISYIPKLPATSMDLYRTKDIIIEAFWNGLGAADRVIKFGTISAVTTGQDADMAQIALPFTYYDAVKPTENKWLMGNIHEK